MHEVEVSYVVRPSAGELLARLSPRSILECAEIYEIHALESTADGKEATVSFEDNEMTVTFAELENGYEYRFVDGADMFDQRYSKITVDDGDETRVSAVTRYSFASFWSFVLDRLAAGTVTSELETTVANLVEAANEDDAGEASTVDASDADAEPRSDGEGTDADGT